MGRPCERLVLNRLGDHELPALCAGRLQAMCLILANFFSVGALLLNFHGEACATLFVLAFQDTINFPIPVNLSSTGLRLSKFLAGRYRKPDMGQRDILKSELR